MPKLEQSHHFPFKRKQGGWKPCCVWLTSSRLRWDCCPLRLQYCSTPNSLGGSCFIKQNIKIMFTGEFIVNKILVSRQDGSTEKEDCLQALSSTPGTYMRRKLTPVGWPMTWQVHHSNLAPPPPTDAHNAHIDTHKHEDLSSSPRIHIKQSESWGTDRSPGVARRPAKPT